MPNRYLIVGVTAVAALLLYIDRVCISILADPIQMDLDLAPKKRNWPSRRSSSPTRCSRSRSGHSPTGSAHVLC